MEIDTKGLAISVWNRFFKQFNSHIGCSGLLPDLNQTIELIALSTVGQDKIECNRFTQKEFREFLKAIGLRKRDGKWVRREFLLNQETWEMFNKTGVFPKRVDQ
jgi:hypothetical protein